MISIDGMRPDFYQDPRYPAPVLRSLAARGAVASGLEPIYPSVTFSNHATLATGVSSSVHGILGNTILSPGKSSFQDDWYFDASFLRARAIWDAAREAGRSVALLRWPGSRGAKADWVVPELFATSSTRPGRDWQLTVESTEPGLLAELRASCGVREPVVGHLRFDEWATKAAIHLLASRRPDLCLVHLVSVDHYQHDGGRDSPASLEAIRRLDAMVGSIVDAVDLSSTCVILAGDHGFMDIRKRIHLNVLFAREGWIRHDGERILDWTVIHHQHCATSAIYSKDPSLEPRILQTLRGSAAGLFRVLDRDDLRALKAFPDAVCAVDALEGFSPGENLSGDLVTEMGRVQGEHGYLPSFHPGMRGGLIVVGGGFRAGRELGLVRMVDIAPTLAELIGAELPDAEGQALKAG